MRFNIAKIEKRLKIKIKNKFLITTALTHKSANKEINNEKLEFLGDRVIALIFARKLFDLYPNESEGILDKRFAKLVNRNTCASISWTIGIKDFIIMGSQKKNITQKDEKILSDTCEALIGAIYLDRGYEYVKEFVLRLWNKEVKKSHITILDSKTKLQEYSLKLYKKLPVYRFLGLKGPKHNPTFKISVLVDGASQFIGFGKSKKLAEQDAADKLIKALNIR
jgi:ribonuclease-3|tara:strand:- start:54 stop:722 length:669 start_codon:yes stop_codon:yes gene_type:complete